jgi:hypothetical protein
VTFEDFTAAVALSYRTTWGEVAAKTVARTARARREQVKIDADGVRRQLRAALGRALIAVTAAERRHALALRTVALADKALAAEQARLTSGGRATSTSWRARTSCARRSSAWSARRSSGTGRRRRSRP